MNHRKVLSGKDLAAAVILDLRGSIWQSLQGKTENSLVAAAIPDFMGSIWESLQGKTRNSLVAAAILDFRPRLGNRCSTIVVAVENGQPATDVAATIFRGRF